MSLAGSLQHDEVHIWQVKLGSPTWDIFSIVLNRDEREKAARYRTPLLQQHYSRCRSALRLILCLYANQSAAGLNFRYGQFGKPELADHHRLHFNLSHSGDHALIAISVHLVGIDLEFMGNANIDLAGLIDLVCHPEEKAALAPLPDAEKSMMFHRLWTQKEAYCKMRGIGLQQSLAALHFSATDTPSVSQVCIEESDHASTFFVHNLNLLDGYAASLCLPLAEARIGLFKA
jgi:4'-phosphopantetheinyl transferase